jgi:hypothetical protein
MVATVDTGCALRALRRLAGALAIAAVTAAAAAGTASAAQLRAGPSNLAGVFAGAGAGDTIVLSSGDYGVFRGAMKPGEVTLTPAPGEQVTMRLLFRPAANITIDGMRLESIEIADSRSKAITVRNSDVTGQTTLRTGELQDAGILLDRNVHRDWNACANCPEGRIWLPENTDRPSGITISNSEFRGGMSDGIQNGSNGTRIVDNTFHDLVPGTPDGVHTDAIQLYGSKNTLIKGNHFYRVPTAIMAPDGADHEIIEDNAIAADDRGYPFAVTLFSDDGSIIRHNTFADGACAFNLRCGILRIGSKSSCRWAEECDPGRGTVVRDNILGEISHDGGSAAIAENSHNLFTRRASGDQALRGRPSFVGGPAPADHAGYALAAGSIGTGSASDGLDRGIRPRSGAAAGPGPGARGGAGAGVTVRALSRLRSIARTGRLRLRIVTRASGRGRVSAAIRPGRALRAHRRGHSRRTVALRSVSLGRRAAGARTVTLRVGRTTRRRLQRSTDAGLTVTVRVGGRQERRRMTIRR